MYLADGSGADARPILAPGMLKNMNPVWSPDGEWIYFGRGSEPQEVTEIDVWRLRPSGGPQHPDTRHETLALTPSAGATRSIYP